MKLPVKLASKKVRIALFAALFLLVLFVASKIVFWMLLFILAASVSELYNIYVRTPIHLDLVKLTTILTAVAYGAPAGIFVGIASTFFSKLFSLRLDARIIVSFIGIVIMAVLASTFSQFPITLLGILLVALYYLVISPINIWLLGTEPAYALAYVGSSLLVNVFLFVAVAPKLITLLT